MKKVPDMSTKESNAVLGSPTTFTVSGVLLFDADGLEVTSSMLELYVEVFTSTTIAEQRLRGCSWNICGEHQQSRGLHDHICWQTQSKDDPNYLGQLWEGLIDEDERDEDGEDLLSETWDKSDQEAALKGHHHHNDDDEPKTDPNPTCQVLHIIALTELEKIRTEEIYLQLKHFIKFN